MSAMSPYPVAIHSLPENVIQIDWSNATSRRYASRELRDKCPCATCREKRNAPAEKPLFEVLTPAEARPLAVTGMRPVGNYAYCIAFSDGHDTGIFTFEFLLAIGAQTHAT